MTRIVNSRAALGLAALTATTIDRMAMHIQSDKTDDPSFDEELMRDLTIAKVALLRWMFVTGEAKGLLQIPILHDASEDG